MSISNEKYSSPKNLKEITFNRLKTISKSIDTNSIHKDKNINSIFNCKKIYNQLNNQITTNTHSIVNIFNPNKKKLLHFKKCDSPIKINLNKNTNNNNSNNNSNNKIDNNLNTIDYSTIDDIKYERKISGKSIKSKNGYSPNKSSNIYKNESLSFEPFSSKRILTIPTQSNHFGYAIDDNGESELLDDPFLYEKFSGTKNNSIGPGRYNVVVSPRKRLIIDWSKISENKNVKSNKKRKIKDIKELNKIDNLYLSTNLDEIYDDIKNNFTVLCNSHSYKYKSINNTDLNKFKNKIFRNNNLGLKDYKDYNNDYINLTSLNYVKQKNEESNMPGPGTYNVSDEFTISPKRNKFQNFGSSVSRDLLYSPKRKKNHSIENYIKYSFFADKSFEDEKNNSDKRNSNEKSKFYHNPSFLTQKLKVELLKERNIKKKKEELGKLGPGFYNPEIQKLKKTNKIGNFGTLEKRTLNADPRDTPGAGSYLALVDWTKKNNFNFRTIETDTIAEKYKMSLLNKNPEKDPSKKNEEINEIYYNDIKDAYNNQSIDYDNKIICMKNKKRPAFGSREPRFHIFESQINKLNGVGEYNLLFPLKIIKQQNAPFITSSSRNNLIKKENANVGPGTYNKYDTFFQWNKKTYNTNVKYEVDKFKDIKK